MPDPHDLRLLAADRTLAGMRTARHALELRNSEYGS